MSHWEDGEHRTALVIRRVRRIQIKQWTQVPIKYKQNIKKENIRRLVPKIKTNPGKTIKSVHLIINSKASLQ